MTLAYPRDLAVVLQETVDRLPFELPKYDIDTLPMNVRRITVASYDDLFAHYEAGTVRFLGVKTEYQGLGFVREWAWVDGEGVIVEYPIEPEGVTR